MPLDPHEAWLAHEQGKTVIVICEECGDEVWTTDAMYLWGEEAWYCTDCNDDLVDEVIDEIVEGWADE
ncbi:MAG: hypothetical protein ABEI98_03625 [Halorhabdus sp.]